MDEQNWRRRVEAGKLPGGRAPRGIRYAAAFRRRAVAVVRDRVRWDVPQAEVVREVGPATASVARWRRPRPAPALRCWGPWCWGRSDILDSPQTGTLSRAQAVGPFVYGG